MATNERDLGVWWLPAPAETRQWLPIPILNDNIRVHTPFGYEKREGDDKHWWPIPHQLDLLEEASKHVKKYTYKDVAAWLSKRAGRSITGEGLRKRLNSEQNSRKRIAAIRRSIARIEAKLKKVEEWEAKVFERYKDAESPVNYLPTE